MTRVVTVALCAVLLSGCGDIHSTRLTPDALENPSKIQQIANRLPPDEREMFGRYVMNRGMSGTGFVKPLVRQDGKDPETVAEALDVVRAFDAREKKIAAIRDEKAEKLAAHQIIMDALDKASVESGYRSAEVDAYNNSIRVKEAIEAEYDRREAAVK